MNNPLVQSLPEDFVSVFADQAVFQGDSGSHYEPCVSWEALNRLLASDVLEYPRIRLVKEGQPFSRAFCGFMRYRQAANGASVKTLNPTLLTHLLGEGCTLVIDRCQGFFPGVQEQVEALGAFFRCPVSASLYVNWGGRSGFGLHNDNHDVIALQIQGQKRWEIYPHAPRTTAAKSFSKPAPAGDPSASHTLRRGEYLYVPRGVWHGVYSEQTPSLHVSFTIFRPRYADLASTILTALAHSSFMSESIPLNTEQVRLDVFEQLMHSALSTASIKYWAAYLENNVPALARQTLDVSQKPDVHGQ